MKRKAAKRMNPRLKAYMTWLCKYPQGFQGSVQECWMAGWDARYTPRKRRAKKP